ncbi:MAG: bifunctional oligoribonuclease/PAP phosphatase NrnA [Cytophagales bacterium]|nr:bifunctional oligoribonuclease/PAP phosphatase NrnA [Bernardetiaceae bacterium]MDW8205287.1 bifunctional oligoribonuclease/PAP phosphatase NrnA [Cytophagales bacterium]
MLNIESLRQALSVPRKIVIIPHQKPDADALGSCLALWNFFKNKGHVATVISPTQYPDFLQWMPGHEETLVYSEATHGSCQQVISEAEIIFCLDFNDLKRCEPLDVLISGNTTAIKAMVDHHQDKKDFANFEYVRVTAAATAELIYELIHLLGNDSDITPPIASCIYAGIMTDTGSFKYPATTPQIHRIVANLMEKGINHSLIHRNIYDNSTLDRLRLKGFALSERLKVIPELHTAYFVLSKADLSRFHHQIGDTEGLVNYGLSIRGVKLSVILKEDEGFVKMSLRSVGSLSVNDIARTHFNGGGHINAAGGRLPGMSIEEAERCFLEVIYSYKDTLADTNN